MEKITHTRTHRAPNRGRKYFTSYKPPPLVPRSIVLCCNRPLLQRNQSSSRDAGPLIRPCPGCLEMSRDVVGVCTSKQRLTNETKAACFQRWTDNARYLQAQAEPNAAIKAQPKKEGPPSSPAQTPGSSKQARMSTNGCPNASLRSAGAGRWPQWGARGQTHAGLNDTFAQPRLEEGLLREIRNTEAIGEVAAASSSGGARALG